MFKIS